MSYGMSYGGDGYYADADYQQLYEEQEEEDFDPQPQQRRNAPRSPGLRAHMKQITAENKALKKQLDEQKQMLQELMDDGSSAAGGAPGGPPVQARPFASDAEQMQYQHMLSQGAMAAPPSGSQAEQINAIRSAKSPDELVAYLRSQGSAVGQNYEGMGF